MERRTRQRDAIREAVTRAGRPLTPPEILEAARAEIPNLGLATVYRTLKLLVDAEAVVQVELPGEPTRYEPRPARGEHHHHFRCRTCATVYDIEGCPGGLGKLLPPGFTLESHDITLYGECDRCSDGPERLRGSRGRGGDRAG